MILTFSRPEFKDRILAGSKVHTIRQDVHTRWRVGMTAQMWMHSPRNVKKNPYQFATATICRIDRIQFLKIENPFARSYRIKLNGQYLSESEISDMATRDGFADPWEFIQYFGEFSGRLIWWTNVRPV